MWEISVYRKRNINAYRARLVTPTTKKKKRRLTNFYKAINQLTPIIVTDYVQTPIRFTRTHDQALIQLPANYEQYKNSFITHTIRVPPELVHVKTIDEFSSRLQLLTA